jgi:hypothetical protein
LGWATLSLLLCPALLLQLKGLAMEKTKKVSASYLKVSLVLWCWALFLIFKSWILRSLALKKPKR